MLSRAHTELDEETALRAKAESEKKALEDENRTLRKQLAASKQIFVQQSEGEPHAAQIYTYMHLIGRMIAVWERAVSPAAASSGIGHDISTRLTRKV